MYKSVTIVPQSPTIVHNYSQSFTVIHIRSQSSTIFTQLFTIFTQSFTIFHNLYTISHNLWQSEAVCAKYTALKGRLFLMDQCFMKISGILHLLLTRCGSIHTSAHYSYKGKRKCSVFYTEY